MRILPLVLSTLFCFSAQASDFSGCKGNKIGKSDGKSVDIASQLSQAEKRIRSLCEKEIPKNLKAVEQKTTACVQGAVGNNGANQYVAANLARNIDELKVNLEKSCEDLKKGLKEAATYCSNRKAKTAAMQKQIQDNVNNPVEEGKGKEEREAGQQAALKKIYDMYSKAEQDMKGLSRESARTSVAVYRKLPDFDEKKADYGFVDGTCAAAYTESAGSMRERREGRESADTKDPKLDVLISDLQKKFRDMEKDNKNAAACKSISGPNGLLIKISKVKRENLWPNGKNAARALKVLANDDCNKANNYKKMAADADAKYKSLSGGSALAPVTAQGQKGYAKEVSRPTVNDKGERDGVETISTGKNGEIEESWVPLDKVEPVKTRGLAATPDEGGAEGVVSALKTVEGKPAAVTPKVEAADTSFQLGNPMGDGNPIEYDPFPLERVPAAVEKTPPVAIEKVPGQTYFEMRTCAAWEWYDRWMGYCK